MTRSTPTEDRTRRVTVCSACLCASCWHGIFSCQGYQDADVADLSVAELDALGREHPSYYSAEQVREVTGA